MIYQLQIVPFRHQFTMLAIPNPAGSRNRPKHVKTRPKSSPQQRLDVGPRTPRMHKRPLLYNAITLALSLLNKLLPMPATNWQLRTRMLDCAGGPAIMGIVNVTPDSFSDGGNFNSVTSATDHALRLVQDGAAILDVGGESTRPYSTPVEPQEELDRVIPVIEAIVKRTAVPISIDTSKSIVAAAAIDAGVEIINDVTGLQGDTGMINVAADTGAGVCAMHMQGTPQTMQDNPTYDDVSTEILAYLIARKRWLLNHGIDASRICLDPGIGFGKTHEHNLQLIHQAERFHETFSPILVGHSRKGFIGKLLGDKSVDRDAGTLGISVLLAIKGIQVIRVHEVKNTADAIACVVRSLA